MGKSKPGYKTTEFYVSLLGMVCGAVLASGAISATGLAAQIIGGILSVLAALGYTASRTMLKSTEILRDD